MLLVLPPSEGKTAPQDGDSLNLASLSFPELNAVRSQVLLALVDLCSQDPDRALGTLKLSDSQTDERDRNLLLKSSPCVPAGELYSGVLYDALGLHDMPPGAQARANEQVVTASALWGLVRPTDLIPAYRLSAGVRLPGLPPLQQLWREPVATALVGDSGIIIDLRSTPYRNLAPIPTAAADRTALVRVWQDQGGKRVAVSHFNKSTKGLLARALLRSRKQPQTLRQLASHLQRLGFQAAIGEQTPTGTGLDIQI